MCWMQLWLLFCLGVCWVHLSSSPKPLIIGSCWDSGLSRNFSMGIPAVPAESWSELDNSNLRKQLHSSHSLEGFIREIPSCVLEMQLTMCPCYQQCPEEQLLLWPLVGIVRDAGLSQVHTLLKTDGSHVPRAPRLLFTCQALRLKPVQGC